MVRYDLTLMCDVARRGAGCLMRVMRARLTPATMFGQDEQRKHDYQQRKHESQAKMSGCGQCLESLDCVGHGIFL